MWACHAHSPLSIQYVLLLREVWPPTPPRSARSAPLQPERMPLSLHVEKSSPLTRDPIAAEPLFLLLRLFQPLTASSVVGPTRTDHRRTVFASLPLSHAAFGLLASRAYARIRPHPSRPFGHHLSSLTSRCDLAVTNAFSHAVLDIPRLSVSRPGSLIPPRGSHPHHESSPFISESGCSSPLVKRCC